MILIRHGQSEFNVHYGRTRQDPGIRDPGLTELGRAQAQTAAHHLANGTTGRRIRRVVSSPYRRTLQTADIIARTLGLDVCVDPCIGERAAFACDVGTPRALLRADWPHIRFDGIAEEWWPTLEESHDALDVRCRRFRQAMAEDADWMETLAVTHWGFIRGLTGHTVENCTMVAFDPGAPHPGGGQVVWLPEL